MLTLDEMKKKKKELGYSNQKISDLSGISFGTVQKIFGGYTETPRHETLAALDAVLNHPRVVYSYGEKTSSSDILVVREETNYPSSAKKDRLYTLNDYYALPDDQRVELIDGVFYDLAAPGYAHQMILGNLFIQLNECIQKHQCDCHVFAAPADVQLDRDEFTMLQPDVFIFCGMENVRKNKYYGAPEFIAEILSPSNRMKYISKKLTKYREAGVKELWFIDPAHLRISVYYFPEEEEDALRYPEKYGFDDKIPLRISEGKCIIDFAKIHEAAKPFMELEE